MSVTRIYGLIAGKGDLPCRVIEKLKQEGQLVYVVAFEGQTPAKTVEDCDHIWVKLGTIAPIFDYLKTRAVTHLILAGGIKRPSLSELSLDWAGTKLLTRIGFRSLGDDGLLSAIVKVFEDEGLTIISADEILQDVLVPLGNLTRNGPLTEDFMDIQRGIDVLMKLGEADVGQAVVIQQGLVLGLEAIEGTSKLIERVAAYHRPGRGGILVKMAKPTQNLKVDLPTIGPETICQAISSGLVGIALEAKRSQILHRQAVIDQANDAGLFIYGFSR